VDVVTDQSVLGLQHAGLDHHARSQIYETSCIKEDDEYNEPIRNVTWRLRQENGKLTYQPSLESCYIFSKDIDEDKDSGCGSQIFNFSLLFIGLSLIKVFNASR